MASNNPAQQPARRPAALLAPRLPYQPAFQHPPQPQPVPRPVVAPVAPPPNTQRAAQTAPELTPEELDSIDSAFNSYSNYAYPAFRELFQTLRHDTVACRHIKAGIEHLQAALELAHPLRRGQAPHPGGSVAPAIQQPAGGQNAGSAQGNTPQPQNSARLGGQPPDAEADADGETDEDAPRMGVPQSGSGRNGRHGAPQSASQAPSNGAVQMERLRLEDPVYFGYLTFRAHRFQVPANLTPSIWTDSFQYTLFRAHYFAEIKPKEPTFPMPPDRKGQDIPLSKRFKLGEGWHRRGYRHLGWMWINIRLGRKGRMMGKDVHENMTLSKFVEGVFRDYESVYPEGYFYDLFLEKQSMTEMIAQIEKKGFDMEKVIVNDYLDGGETLYFEVFSPHGTVQEYRYVPPPKQHVTPNW